MDVELWKRGPEWLCDKMSWPEEKVSELSPETQGEAKITKEVLVDLNRVYKKRSHLICRIFVFLEPQKVVGHCGI